MRRPDWRPTDAVGTATRAAILWWQERFPRRKRPAFQDAKDEFLAYAFTMRNWTPEQIRYIADSVLKRTSNHWPDHAELEAEYDALKQRHEARRASDAPVSNAWSGREDDRCPSCAAHPVYEIVDNAWMYALPCACRAGDAYRCYSLWLRGIVARPEDDPIALAALYREASEQLVTAARRDGRSMASLVQQLLEPTPAPPAVPADTLVAV